MSLVYLHFLDRELRDSLQVSLDRIPIGNVIKHLLLFSNAQFYIGLSFVLETLVSSKEAWSVCTFLLKRGVLDIVSRESAGEFLETRLLLYGHDDVRYPYYFRERTQASSMVRLYSPTMHKSGSTTQDLIGKLNRWSKGVNQESTAQIERHARNVVEKGLQCRENEAITFSHFRKTLQDDERHNLAALIIRKEISRAYLSHYVYHVGGDIITGIPGLSHYDDIAARFPLLDFQIFCRIGECFGLHRLILNAPIEFWERLIYQRQNQKLGKIYENIQYLIKASQRWRQIGYSSQDSQLQIRHRLLEVIDHEWKKRVSTQANITDPDGVIQYLLEETYNLRHRLSQERDFMAMTESADAPRIALLTANRTETQNMLELAQVYTGREPTPLYTRDQVYWALGQLGGCDLFLVKTEMGADGSRGSTLTVNDTVVELRPSAVIAVGIAFGMKPDKQKLGDVLIASFIRAYDQQKIATLTNNPGTPQATDEISIIARGPRSESTPRLFAKLEAFSMTYKNCDFHIGLVMSGDKLVKNQEFRDSLLKIEPEAIGGEMEGSGLLFAVTKHQTPWALVKGIADWGDKNKDDTAHGPAVRNAGKFVLETIKSGAFLML